MIHSVWSQSSNYANNLICNLVELQNDTVDIVKEPANGSYYPNLKYKYADSTLSYPAYKYTILDTSLIAVVDTFMQTYTSFCDAATALFPTTCVYFNGYGYGDGFKLKKDITVDTFVKGTFTLKSQFKYRCTFDITFRLPAGLVVTGVADKEIQNNSKITYSNNQLYFENDNNEVLIYNQIGMPVLKENVRAKQMDVSGLKPGVYVVNTSTGTHLKFIKE
jgi:hypothetical protein